MVKSFPNLKTETDGMYASMQLALSRTLWPLLLRQTMAGLKESQCCQSPCPYLPRPPPARQHLWSVFKWCRSCTEHTNATTDLFASHIWDVSGLSVKARQIMPRAFSKFETPCHLCCTFSKNKKCLVMGCLILRHELRGGWFTLFPCSMLMPVGAYWPQPSPG